MQQLIDIETQGWRALSTAADAARTFYSHLLREDAVMLFPGGLCIAGRSAILDALGTQPWKSFQLADARVLRLSEDAAAVLYTVRAHREGSAPYAALVSSTYSRGPEGWQLVLHQQTPH